MRITILAVPPVIPLIHAELHLSEAQVGLLVEPAAAAVRARRGAGLAAGASARHVPHPADRHGRSPRRRRAGRGGAANVWTLLAATFVMGFGVAIMQPALPALVREWMPQRIALGAATSTNGLVMGGMLAPALTAPLVLPLAGDSWRLDLVVWAAPVLATALVFVAACATQRRAAAVGRSRLSARWWPDWKNPLVWLLGLTFGANNAMYLRRQRLPPRLSRQPRPRRSDRPALACAQRRAARRLAAPDAGRRPAAALALAAVSRVRSDLARCRRSA